MTSASVFSHDCNSSNGVMGDLVLSVSLLSVWSQGVFLQDVVLILVLGTEFMAL